MQDDKNFCMQELPLIGLYMGALPCCLYISLPCTQYTMLTSDFLIPSQGTLDFPRNEAAAMVVHHFRVVIHVCSQRLHQALPVVRSAIDQGGPHHMARDLVPAQARGVLLQYLDDLS